MSAELTMRGTQGEVSFMGPESTDNFAVFLIAVFHPS